MIIGAILILIGFVIRLWAIKSMSGRFTFQIRPPEKLCTTGAYRFIRHPAYIGSWMILVGLALIHPVAGVTYLAFVFFLARAIQEEMFLSQIEEYRDYQNRTGMFIPKATQLLRKENDI